MLGPICKYSPMPKLNVDAALRDLGVEYAELEGGLEVPAIDALWRKASKQCEMAVRTNHFDVMVWQAAKQSLKYLYKKGTVEADGYCIYRHCRSMHPDLYFRYIGKKYVSVDVVGLTEEGQLECKIMGCLSGEELCTIVLSPRQTIAFARKEIHDLLLRNLKVIGMTVLEIVTFQGHCGHAKLKTAVQPPEQAPKRLKFDK